MAQVIVDTSISFNLFYCMYSYYKKRKSIINYFTLNNNLRSKTNKRKYLNFLYNN